MPDRISNEAVAAATGKGWDEWLRLLNQSETEPRPHKDLVAYLRDVHHLPPWWCQRLALAYEQNRGRRVVGQSVSVGFEIGARKTLPISPEVAWALVTSPRGLAVWLGEVASFQPVEGYAYQTASGATGVLRVVKPRQMMRLTWQPAGWKKPSTIQIRLLSMGEAGTVVSFHQEQLPDEAARQQRRQHWQRALATLEKMGVRRP